MLASGLWKNGKEYTSFYDCCIKKNNARAQIMMHISPGYQYLSVSFVVQKPRIGCGSCNDQLWTEKTSRFPEFVVINVPCLRLKE